MMKNQSMFLLSVLFFFLTIQLKAQTTVQYSYDKAGNRIQRKLYVCTTCRPDQQNGKVASQEKDTTQILAAQHGLNVYPNPTQDKVNLTLSNLKDDETTSVVVTDETGKTVYSAKNLQLQNEINVSTFNNGTYFFRITMGKDVMVYKVMKIQ
jgi:hypothetical protein